MEDPVHLRRDLLPGVTLQLDTTEEEGETLESLAEALGRGVARRRRVYLGVEQQVLPDGEVVKQNVMLGAQTQTAANQSHVLANVIAIDVGPPTGRWVQTWMKHN